MQGCILYANWWPMLTAFLYVLVPMPYMFFGAGSGDSLYSNDMEIGCAADASPECSKVPEGLYHIYKAQALCAWVCACRVTRQHRRSRVVLDACVKMDGRQLSVLTKSGSRRMHVDHPLSLQSLFRARHS
jgi:Vacuolar protein sorting 55